MKVAVFGGTGFVGSYLVEHLIDQGHHPRLLVRKGSDSKVVSSQNCEIINGDINDKNSSSHEKFANIRTARNSCKLYTKV